MLFITTQRTLQNVRDVCPYRPRSGMAYRFGAYVYTILNPDTAPPERERIRSGTWVPVLVPVWVGGVMLDGGGVGVGAGVGRCVFFATKVRRRRRRRGTVG